MRKIRKGVRELYVHPTVEVIEVKPESELLQEVLMSVQVVAVLLLSKVRFKLLKPKKKMEAMMITWKDES